MRTTTVQLSTLVPDPENPRAHDQRNLDAIAASLRDHGQVEPLLVQKSSRMIIAGNGRAEAMRSLGWTEAHVVLLDVDDVQARKLSIQLNRSGELATWDEAVLTKHLQELDGLADYDVGSMGFSEDELQMLAAAYGDAVAPEQGEPAVADPVNGAAPAPEQAAMPNSSVRMVQLYLDNATVGPFQKAVRKLAAAWDKDNQTDTVLHAVLTAAESL
jgi:ParB-like chromosome segregation protein Spo0J